MLQQDKSETLDSSYSMPWSRRFSAEQCDITYPDTLGELADWPYLDRIGRYHLAYLEAVNDSLHGNWLEHWEQILVVGPFINCKRRYTDVPVLIIASDVNVGADLQYLGKILADAYIAFNILPDLHLLSVGMKEGLEQAHDERWERTKRLSIALPRS